MSELAPVKILPMVPQEREAPRSTMDMVAEAVSRGASIEVIERLMKLHEGFERAQANKAFIEAKAAFKMQAPKIVKDKDNRQYGSKYTSIGNLVTNVNEVLGKYGLDASWDIKQQGEEIEVTCILSHTLGHSERVSMKAPPDKSGGEKAKNPIQQIKSTTTYLKVATYEAVTGIATNEANLDDDGNAAGGNEAISEAQVDELIALADDVGANKALFCKYLKIDSFASIRAKDFERAKKALESKRRAG